MDPMKGYKNDLLRHNMSGFRDQDFDDLQPSNHTSQHEAGSQPNQILHEAIIDLYLQVKVRSNDEIDKFG